MLEPLLHDWQNILLKCCAWALKYWILTFLWHSLTNDSVSLISTPLCLRIVDSRLVTTFVYFQQLIYRAADLQSWMKGTDAMISIILCQSISSYPCPIHYDWTLMPPMRLAGGSHPLLHRMSAVQNWASSEGSCRISLPSFFWLWISVWLLRKVKNIRSLQGRIGSSARIPTPVLTMHVLYCVLRQKPYPRLTS